MPRVWHQAQLHYFCMKNHKAFVAATGSSVSAAVLQDHVLQHVPPCSRPPACTSHLSSHHWQLLWHRSSTLCSRHWHGSQSGAANAEDDPELKQQHHSLGTDSPQTRFATGQRLVWRIKAGDAHGWVSTSAHRLLPPLPSIAAGTLLSEATWRNGREIVAYHQWSKLASADLCCIMPTFDFSTEVMSWVLHN